MKKLLSLLSVLTITGTSLPNVIAASNYEKQNLNTEINNLQIQSLNRYKRQTPPSLQNIITTVNIGEIRINNQEHIIARLREINHPILSRPDFLEHIIFDDISNTNAIIHSSYTQNQEPVISNNIKFTIEFSVNRPLLSSIIRNRNLGNIFIILYDLRINNYMVNQGFLINELVRLNPNLNNFLDCISIYHENVNLNGAVISLTPQGRNFFTEDYVYVTYNNFINSNWLNSVMVNNTNLGQITDNNQETILARLQELNTNINIHNFSVILSSVTENSAIIIFDNPNNGSNFVNYSFMVTFNIFNNITSLFPDCNNPYPAVFNFLSFSRAAIDNDKNIKFCLKNKLYYDSEKDYFRVWGKNGHDGIELKLSLKTVVFLKKFIELNNIKKTKKYLKNLINNIKAKDETRWLGQITNSDKELMINFICDGYLMFNDKLLKWVEMIKNIDSDIKNYSMFIRTWRTYNWEDLSEEYKNSAFYISQESKDDNYNYIDNIKQKTEFRSSNDDSNIETIQYNEYITTKYDFDNATLSIICKIDDNSIIFKNLLKNMGFNSEYLILNFKFQKYF